MIPNVSNPTAEGTTVGIVGGGIAGLYTALLLKAHGIKFHIFEGTGRVGGRVHTHYFSPEQDQYFEAGAMRIPESPVHKITFDLVDYLNQTNGAQLPDHERHIKLIDYILTAKGNQIFVNGITRDRYNATSADSSPEALGWSVPEPYKKLTSTELLMQAISKLLTPLEDALKESLAAFEKEFLKTVAKWDRFSFRSYLLEEYPTTVIDFIETVESQTNQFALSVPELLVQNLDFNTKSWKTIDKGMSRLPQAMLAILGNDNVTFGARVTAIRPIDSTNRVEIVALGANGRIEATFDKVVLAIPPAALKMIAARPLWSPTKKWRFARSTSSRCTRWACVSKHASGSRSRTLPKAARPRQTHLYGGSSSRRMGSENLAILKVFSSSMPGSFFFLLLSRRIFVDHCAVCRMTDAVTWLPLTPVERRSLALHNLGQVYNERIKARYGDKVTVGDLLIETFDAVWSASTATGDAMFLPGQWIDRFDACREPESNNRIFFAGEHVSYHHTWISGAAHSAHYTACQMFPDLNIQPLTGITGISAASGLKLRAGRNDEPTPASPSADTPAYEDISDEEDPSPNADDADAFIDGAFFKFFPNDPLDLHGNWQTDGGRKDSLPASLGGSIVHPLGPEINHLRAVFSTGYNPGPRF
ncbi:hypothetical protein HGRIS_011823 [Hohenbuehelia grisea]|uniref:Amine oxidase domain-containing protein n=1 Tax=Hohenbuehelia grisea TaxID=104357 RepID=A0ABR3JX55_9AGAR